MISGLIITSFGASAEATNAVDEKNITVPTACTMGGTIVQGEEHATSFQPGIYESETDLW